MERLFAFYNKKVVDNNCNNYYTADSEYNETDTSHSSTSTLTTAYLQYHDSVAGCNTWQAVQST